MTADYTIATESPRLPPDISVALILLLIIVLALRIRVRGMAAAWTATVVMIKEAVKPR